MLRFTNCLVLSSILFLLSPVLGQDEPNLGIETGWIIGKWDTSRDGRTFASFQGIPYAQPPVRFEPPVKVNDFWIVPRNCTKPGSICPQFNPMALDYAGQEDCLYVNVYTPANFLKYSNLTTMFWIHGGGYLFGAGSNLGPRYFMDQDEVILVTVNYRLGAFGFLDAEDRTVAGNMAFKDMILALKWVQSNIKSFGGDPAKVTIFGESAGGAAVHSLMLSPAARGLFRSVIAQSGSALVPWNVVKSPAVTFKDLANRLGCTGPGNFLLAECLKEKPFLDILQAQSNYSFAPTIDSNQAYSDAIFPEPMESLFELYDNSKDLPLIIGRTEVELLATAVGSLNNSDFVKALNQQWTQTILSLVDYKALIDPKDNVDRVAEAIRNFYFGGRKEIVNDAKNINSFEQLLTDFFFHWGAKKSALLNAKYGAKVYPYTFVYRGNFSLMDISGGPKKDHGPVHADELQYTFNSLHEPTQNWPDLQKGSLDEEFSRQLISLWVSFAKNGKPDPNPFDTTWKEIPPKSGKDLNSVIDWFILDTKSESVTESDELNKRIKFWNEIFKYNSSSASLSVNSMLLVVSGLLFKIVMQHY